MRRIFLASGIIVAVVGLNIWILMGANRGWTKTSEMITVTDEVTGLEGVNHEVKFKPGVDFLGAAFGAGFLLCAIGLFMKKQKPHEHA